MIRIVKFYVLRIPPVDFRVFLSCKEREREKLVTIVSKGSRNCEKFEFHVFGRAVCAPFCIRRNERCCTAAVYIYSLYFYFVRAYYNVYSLFFKTTFTLEICICCTVCFFDASM